MIVLEPGDNPATIASIGLLAYASADIAHHVFGHAVACLLTSGQVSLVTSQIVHCTVTGSTVDLAGPLASLILGLAAVVSAQLAARLAWQPSPEVQLMLILVAAFNLFWFNLQLLYSAASGKDDWAWALHEFHVPPAGRCLLAVAGALGYFFTVSITARYLKRYARPPQRISKICLLSWLSAGVLACLTATFAHEPGRALRDAIPQAMLLSIGLLFIPARASRLSEPGVSAASIGFSPVRVGAALLVSAASIFFLGRGFSI